MSEADPPAPSPGTVPPQSEVLRARIAGHGVIEQLLACQERTSSGRPLDDQLRCGLDPEAESWYSGALGEIRVGLMLATLGAGWTVLHSIPVGERGSDLDHLVIGPAGVYVINTKRHFGRRVWAAGHGLRVDNHQVPYLRNLEYEMTRTETALKSASGLSVDAIGVIAVVDAASLTVTAPPAIPHREAHVMDAGALVGFLQSRARVFNDEQVARVVDAAERAETWTTKPVRTTDGDALRLQFETMRARVEAGARASAVLGSPPPLARRQATAPAAAAPSGRGTRTRGQARGVLAFVIGAAALIGAFAIAWSGLTASLARMTEPPPLFADAAEEQAALIESAGTAAALIDQHSATGARPAQLIVTPETSVLQTTEGITVVDLPDGTAVAYAPSADLLTYSLTLTGPQFGTVVTVSPETGVVPTP